MKTLLLILLFVSRTAAGFEYSDEEIRNMEEGLRQWRELAANPEAIPEEERFDKLGQGLRKTARKDIYALGDREKVHVQLRDALLSLEGYGDYFANRLRANREEAKGKPGSINRLEEAQLACFDTLGMLPSPESVRVLGEFLFDEEERVPPSPPGQRDDRNMRQRELGVGFNASYSLAAIAKLPIVSPPVPKRKRDRVDYDEDIESWRIWYQQVKSGKRTFRFEGDPQIYNLTGPVSETRESKSAGSPAASKEAPASSLESIHKATSFPAWAFTLAGVLLALAIWFATKRKPAAS